MAISFCRDLKPENILLDSHGNNMIHLSIFNSVSYGIKHPWEISFPSALQGMVFCSMFIKPLLSSLLLCRCPLVSCHLPELSVKIIFTIIVRLLYHIPQLAHALSFGLINYQGRALRKIKENTVLLHVTSAIHGAQHMNSMRKLRFQVAWEQKLGTRGHWAPARIQPCIFYCMTCMTHLMSKFRPNLKLC